jgi:hypothetical protein
MCDGDIAESKSIVNLQIAPDILVPASCSGYRAGELVTKVHDQIRGGRRAGRQTVAGWSPDRWEGEE